MAPWRFRGSFSAAALGMAGLSREGVVAAMRVAGFAFDFSAAGTMLASGAPVAQLDRVTASGAVGCGFDPRRVQKTLWDARLLFEPLWGAC
jgi:hypothetical protein